MLATHRQPRWMFPIRLTATALLLVWTGFWLWFCGASLASEWDGSVPWEPVLKIVLPIVALGGLGLAAPRVGGLLLIPASVFAAWFFDNTAVWWMFALPMFVTGPALVVTGPWVRSVPRRGRAEQG